MDHAQAAVIAIAETFIGLKEIEKNAKWTGDPDLAKDVELLLDKAGHVHGLAYCLFFAKGTWIRLLENKLFSSNKVFRQKTQEILDLMHKNGAVVPTSGKLRAAGLLHDAPKAGAIMLLQLGNTWRGHCGIVTGFDEKNIITVDGNTSLGAGLSREGDGIAEKNYKLAALRRKNDGFNLLGFVYLPDFF